MSGYAYYSGPRFAVYGAGSSDALARGGRYDEVGAVFGRNRPAVGFSLDLKTLAEVSAGGAGADRDTCALGRGRRASRRGAQAARGRARPCCAVLPGHEPETSAFECDRELVPVGGRWVLRAIDAAVAPTS